MIIKPANRMNHIREYYFSEKTREIERLNQSGLPVINLGIGSPDLAPDPWVIEQLRDEILPPDCHSYQNYKGIPELREAFSSWYRDYYHVTLNPETEIQLLTGSKEGVLLVSLALLNPGDKVLVPDPGYPTYSSATRLAEAHSLYYNLQEETGWMPNFEDLEKMDLSGVKMMWTNYPNMPTGAAASVDIYQKLVDFGNRHDILICNDNPYSFILTGEPLSILNIKGAKNCCIELNSMSKTFNMAGWRIGMIVGNKEIISNVLKVKSNMDSGMFRPLQLAATQALTLGKEWIDHLNREYQERQKLAEKVFRSLGVTFKENSCGLFLWGKVGYQWQSGKELSDHLLHRARVFVTPGFIFGSNGNSYVRISLCANQDTFKEVIERIERHLDIHPLSYKTN